MDKKLFFETVASNFCKEIQKSTLIFFCMDYNISIKTTDSRAKIVDAIENSSQAEMFYETYKDVIFIPAYKIAKELNCNKKDLSVLLNLQIVKSRSETISVYSRNERGYIDVLCYSADFLDTDSETVKSALDDYYSQACSIRIETKKHAQIKDIISLLEKLFYVEEDKISSYEQRNGSGYYHYLRVHPLSDQPGPDRQPDQPGPDREDVYAKFKNIWNSELWDEPLFSESEFRKLLKRYEIYKDFYIKNKKSE